MMNKYFFGMLLALIMIGCGGDGTSTSNDGNGTDNGNDIVVIKAVASVTPKAPLQGDIVTLDASGSSSTGGEIDFWRWSENGKRLSTKESFSRVFSVGEHTVYLTIKDKKYHKGNTSVTFTVKEKSKPAPKDTVPPVITLNGDNPMVLKVNDNFSDPKASAEDAVSGSVDVESSGSVNTSKVGIYTIYYTAKDKSGNEANASRIVQVGTLGEIDSTTLEFKNGADSNESIIFDVDNNLTWGNDERNASETTGCYLVGSGSNDSEVLTGFKDFCSRSTYAGFSDWRTPSSEEVAMLLVRLGQEKAFDKLGMAKQNCARFLAVDNNTTIKTVWTHRISFQADDSDYDRPNTIYQGYVESSTTFPAGGRCVRGPEYKGSSRFKLNMGRLKEAKTVTDNTTNLMWVNEFNRDNKACLAIHHDKLEEYNRSKSFCEALNYAGYQDWRAPTSKELTEFIIETNKAHVRIGYEAPCKRLLARERDGSEYAISTRYADKLGSITPLEKPLSSNIGLRCVRSAN